MKTRKIKETVCAFSLALCLAGNTFASNNTNGSQITLFGFIQTISDYVLQMIDDPCEGRICTTCHPSVDGNDCRPPRD